uniref:Uncharacterized protein n=1 Tax=Brassica campestris TaxID=3711 RepID=A0A3P5ZZD0_BRACM|nr:unnamed protein product [Brassica rapa]
MIEAGVISEAILPSSASFPFPSHAVIVHAPRQTQDTNPLPGGAATGVDIDAQLPSTDLVMSTKNDIPQNDGSGDGDDADIKPNTNAPYVQLLQVKKKQMGLQIQSWSYADQRQRIFFL